MLRGKTVNSVDHWFCFRFWGKVDTELYFILYSAENVNDPLEKLRQQSTAAFMSSERIAWGFRHPRMSTVEQDYMKDRKSVFSSLCRLFLIVQMFWLAASATPGWKGELYKVDHKKVKNNKKIASVQDQIIQGSRTVVVWNELNIKTENGNPWPTPPVADTNGSSAHEHFFARFYGLIDIPSSGVYRFYLSSDDGSKLLIDGEEVSDEEGKIALKLGRPLSTSPPPAPGQSFCRCMCCCYWLQVIDNDGLHTAQTKQNTERLDEGVHFIEVCASNSVSLGDNRLICVRYLFAGSLLSMGLGNQAPTRMGMGGQRKRSFWRSQWEAIGRCSLDPP